jgi:K+-sensing histidine kinase KdpD
MGRWSVLSAGRVVACMDPAAPATQVLQAAARLAEDLRTSWYAVYVTPRAWTRACASHSALSDNIRAAQQLGGIVVHVTADRPELGVSALADREGATHVIFGQHQRRPRWHRSTAAELRRTIRSAALVPVDLKDE